MEGCIILMIVIVILLLICKYLKHKQIEKFVNCVEDDVALQGLTCNIVKKKCDNYEKLGCAEYVNKLECCKGDEAKEGGMGGCDPTCDLDKKEPGLRDSGWYQ